MYIQELNRIYLTVDLSPTAGGGSHFQYELVNLPPNTGASIRGTAGSEVKSIKTEIDLNEPLFIYFLYSTSSSLFFQ